MIQVDFQSFVPHELLAMLGPEFMETVLDDVAALARAKWIKLAQQKLSSSKRDYIDGIQAVSGSGGERQIVLAGVLPNMVERGIDAYDMRETLLGEGKGKRAADGSRYRAIPFRHSTPGGRGQAGAEMGSQYGPAPELSRALRGRMEGMSSDRLGKAIYDQAKKLRGGRRLGRRTMVQVPGQGQMAVPKLAPHHSTDIFAGMQRSRKTYARATQSKYTTFRTISDKTTEGWIHPGITGRGLAAEVEQHTERLVADVLSSALNRALRPGGRR
jgi:hypothetical protein